MNEEFVAIAKLLKPRGLRGEIVAEILTDFPERFEDLAKVFAVGENGETFELELEKFWFQKGRVILKFKDYDSIESAENLRNFEICIPESEAVELETDEFFDWQLQECFVETVEGAKIGKVREIMRTGATEILVVEDKDDAKKDYLIPFAEAICTEVDIENRLIKVDLPEGILEF
jgi:16S rRNA processing protein RimM